MKLHLGYLPGCIGRVTELQAVFYARTAGFGVAFEAKVATELSEFCLRCVEGRDGLWLALDDRGTVQGSIVIDSLHADDEGAHLRWFIVSDEARGTGVGRRLLGAALDWCDARAYRRVYLWTFDELHAARHLYLQHGFRLEHAQRGVQWGREVNEQRYARGAA